MTHQRDDFPYEQSRVEHELMLADRRGAGGGTVVGPTTDGAHACTASCYYLVATGGLPAGAVRWRQYENGDRAAR